MAKDLATTLTYTLRDRTPRAYNKVSNTYFHVHNSIKLDLGIDYTKVYTFSEMVDLEEINPKASIPLSTVSSYGIVSHVLVLKTKEPVPDYTLLNVKDVFFSQYYNEYIALAPYPEQEALVEQESTHELF